MDKAVIESVKGRRHNGHPAIGHESYRRSEAVVANTPEPRMSRRGLGSYSQRRTRFL